MEKQRHLQHASIDEIEQMNAMDDIALVNDVGAWANRNFAYHNPWLGMLEELGEITHALLKRAQKIRGYDDPEKFKADFSDAVADFCVYGAHYAFLHPEEPFNLDPVPVRGNADEILARLLRALSDLAPASMRQPGQLRMAVNCVSNLAFLEGIDLRETTYAVWDEIVSKRNWVEHNKLGVPC